MKQFLCLLTAVLTLINCSKKGSAEQPSSSSNEFDRSTATCDRLNMQPYGVYGDYIEVSFFKFTDINASGSGTSFRAYTKDDNGAYKLIFKGEQGGMVIARDSALRGASSTGLTYNANYSDTFCVYKVTDNSLYKTIVLNKGGINRDLYFAFPTSSRSVSQTRDYANSFVKNIMPTMRFKER